MKAIILNLYWLFNSNFNDFSLELICNKTITDESGIITSPNYPYNYPVNLNCSYYLPAQPDRIIILEFTSIRLDVSDANCLGDYIHLYQNHMDYLAGPICSNSTVGVSFQSNSSLTLQFHSNALNTGLGFQAKYRYGK